MQLTGLDTSPMCIGYMQDPEQETEKMILGDDQGNIALYDVHGGDNCRAEPNCWADPVRIYPSPSPNPNPNPNPHQVGGSGCTCARWTCSRERSLRRSARRA